MRACFPALCLLASSISAVAETELTEGAELEVHLTAYYEGETDQVQYGKKNAIDSNLKSSETATSAAADWSIFPPGTTFRVEGDSTTYVIDDYGSALVGKKVIDLHATSPAEVRRFNSRDAKVKIIKVGSFEKALKVLSGRLKHSHCAAMHRAITAKLAKK